jgi:alkenylglycerophosphocholine/alkenylglycerophosphoethanolamine hydrolase
VTGAFVLLLALALVAAVADWVAVDRGWRALEYVCKPLTLLLLIGAALALDPDDTAVRTWFVAALVLSLAGDVFLMLEDRVAGLFVAGLGSFLFGHLAYIGGMVVDGIVLTRFGIGLALVALAVAVLGLTILRAVRAGSEPELVGPVSAYIAVISLMVACAIGVGHPAAVIGAALFYASDSCIAWNRFVRELPHGRVVIMSTYHLAQVGLVLSLL